MLNHINRVNSTDTYQPYNSAISNNDDVLIREIIQNSIDANNSSEAVVVEFNLKYLNYKTYDQYAKHKNIAHNHMVGGSNISDQLNLVHKTALDKEEIPVLIASDYKTKGLPGADDKINKRFPWHAVYLHNNANVKSSDDSAGSHGKGKMAAFNASEMTTVFYNTLYNDDSNITKRFFAGITYFGATKFEGKEIQNKTYHCDSIVGDLNYPVPFDHVPNYFNELVDRNEQGTDVIILAVNNNIEENYEAIVKESVISNFFYAIIKKTLIVKVNGVTIDHNSFKEIFDEVSKKDFDKNHPFNQRIEYINTLLSENCIETTLHTNEYGGFHVKLAVDSEEFRIKSKKAACFRRQGMLVNEFKYHQDKNFCAIVSFLDKGISTMLKNAENAEHTDWDIGGLTNSENDEKVKKLVIEIRRKLRDFISEYTRIENTGESKLHGLSINMHGNYNRDISGEEGLRAKISKTITHEEKKPIKTPEFLEGGSSGKKGGGIAAPDLETNAGEGEKTKMIWKNIDNLLAKETGSGVEFAFNLDNDINGALIKVVYIGDDGKEVGVMHNKKHNCDHYKRDLVEGHNYICIEEADDILGQVTLKISGGDTYGN